VNDQPPDRARKPVPQLADYPHRVTDNIRFGDLDPQGHVNQATFLTYFETGRVTMFRNKDLGIGILGLTYVLVRIEVDYIRELLWPGAIDIGSGIAEFGRSSFKVEEAIFRDGAVAAMARATLVCMDQTTRKSTPLPQAAIEQLSKFKLKSG
jgi:acyl-CoA thioester hydrolase